MRHALLAILALCSLTTAAHAAQGVNLRWDGCLADGGVLNKNFACDTNAGSEQLVVSFELDAEFGPVTGAECALIFDVPSGLPGSWWQFRNSGTCRQNALGFSAIPPTVDGACIDPWQGQAAGGVAFYDMNYGPGEQFRMAALVAVPTPVAPMLQPGHENFALRLTISHTKTVGAGSCAGCLQPVCMGIESLRLTRPAGMGDLSIYTETGPRSSVASWQGSPVSSELYVSPSPLHPYTARLVSCSGAVPARNHTWGSIKSLYH